MKKNKILIVDDIEVNRMILAELFKDDYDVIEAENGLVAFDIISKDYEDIALLIVDIVMPVMNGFELLDILSKNVLYSNIVKIVISGADDEENKRKAIKYGASDLIVKPFEPYEIRNRIKNLMTNLETEKLREENNKLREYFKIRSKFENFIDKIPAGVALCEIGKDIKDGLRVIYANDYLYNEFGFFKDNNDTYVKQNNTSIVKGDLDNIIKCSIFDKESSETVVDKFRIINQDGTYSWTMVSGKKIEQTDNSAIYFAVFMDITKNIVYENELIHRLEYDELTDIYNKELFYKKTQEMLINNLNINYVVVCLDVEKFKLINDLYGLEEGDKILKTIAKCIKLNMNSEKSVFGRLYADHFALCFEKFDGYLDKLVYLTKNCFANYPIDLNVIVKLGFYEVENHTITVNKMCDRANLAIDSIKGNYKKIYAFYQENLRNELIEEQEIVNEMYKALKNEQFNVYYQPKCNLITGEVIGAEALVRWNHPKKGILTPNKFIKIFEKSGFITNMDEFVWESVCRQLRKWLDSGYKIVPISVNISRIDIYNKNLCNTVASVLRKYSIPADLLHIEITETAYTENPKQLIEIIRKLKKIGIIIEMDDFGDGYSSLNMLSEVPVDILKLDLKFLNPTNKKDSNKNIIKSIIYMANELNLEVIAEGIEHSDQIKYLLNLGCNIGQGYFFSKPVEPYEFEKLL
ncbi:EAL domain-containing protein [Sedimentibacter sp. zth1]|uniref:two-component system response regulator n=1 Tax=Sedimentibacter sp. zth1 TaxID=2816908 RepID=UPI001A92FD56|nr:EAL domain-containing protein [Sedimentibacter sp. zth1]QSX06414.1 EAL domain-containing protein [Sedimentibacter sp. zth1]